MANYTKTTDFAAKDTLPGGDTNKVVRGTEFETEFDAISTAIATKSDTAGPTFTGTATFANLTASGTVNFNGATISNLGTITTANLDGGTADNMVIGGSTAAAGTFTTLAATSATVGGSAVLTSVAFSDLDAGAVTLSSETFSDVDNQIPTNAAVIDYVAATIPSIAEVNDLSANVTWANVPDANITQSSVTQHQAALSITASQLSDVTSTAAELNILDGVTATTAELNYVDGVTSNIQTQIDNINPSPILTATASGALGNGDTVIVNSDGTVTAVTGSSVSQGAGSATVFESATTYSSSIAYDANAQKVVVAYVDNGNSNHGTAVVGTVSGSSISFGTPVVFESASVSGFTKPISVVYDDNAQKVVIAYADQGNSGKGTAIVGTVSGTSISFGTAVEFEAGNTDYLAAAYDSNAQKVVIAYRDNNNSDYGTSIVGTVSGTSISFGTAVVFASAGTQHIDAAYDANAQKVVITYRDAGNSNYGTAIVGTVSGTSISYGSEVVFNSASTFATSITYESSAQKLVIAYRDGGNSNYGTAIVGTVAGTSISFGSEVVFDNGGTVAYIATAYDSNAGKITIAYRDGGNSDYGTAIPGTVSGTSITFGSETVFESAETNYPAAVYDANAKKVVIAYQDAGNSNHGTGVVFTNASSSTNLTAENYIGISDAAYSDGATATIQLVGSVDDAQSSLTAGQQYFVQKDGSLGLTADNPSVVAGTAVSATEIIVKG